MIPGHPAFGSRVWPLGDLPPSGNGTECCGTLAWARHPLAASKLLEEASRRQRRAGGDAARGGQEDGVLIQL